MAMYPCYNQASSDVYRGSFNVVELVNIHVVFVKYSLWLLTIYERKLVEPQFVQMVSKMLQWEIHVDQLQVHQNCWKKY